MDRNREVVIVPIEVKSVKHKIFNASFLEKLLKIIKEKNHDKNAT